MTRFLFILLISFSISLKGQDSHMTNFANTITKLDKTLAAARLRLDAIRIISAN